MTEPPTTRPATADVLAELRARASKKIDDAHESMKGHELMSLHHYGQWSYSYAFLQLIEWLDELAPTETTTTQDPPC